MCSVYPSDMHIASGRGSWCVTSEEFSRHFMYYHHLLPDGNLLSGEATVRIIKNTY